MKSKFPLLLLITFLGWNSAISALGQVQTKQLLWYGYTFSADLGPRWFLETEIMERHLVNPLEQSQFLIRTRFHKKLTQKMNVGFGGSLFLFHKPGSNTHLSFTQPELRPHGEVNLRSSLGSVAIENRWRGEFRFFQNTNFPVTELQEGFHYSAARFRYRLQAIVSLAKFAETKILRLKLANEVMAMAGGRMERITFDQNRISADLSVDISPKISLDLGYVNWYQAKSTGGFLEQHIFRSVLKHQLTPAKR